MPVPPSPSWFGTLPRRGRALVLPYAQALSGFVAVYGGATALLRPWAWGHWWSLGGPLAVGFGACWWLWRPWAVLAPNGRGETRWLPLLFTWALLVAVGGNLRDYLRYRLGEVRDLRSAHELAQPGEAVFFRLHGAYYPDRPHLGRYAAPRVVTLKGGTRRYTATVAYACPLLAAATDTSTARLALRARLTPPAWLAYTDQQVLGDNLMPGEADWRFANFVARTDARFASLNLADFTYLMRSEGPEYALHRAVRASPLAPYWGSPLLLQPVQAPFAERGAHARQLLLWLLLLGSTGIIGLLLGLPLRPNAAD